MDSWYFNKKFKENPYMIGFAQKLFLEKTGKTFTENKKKTHHWPFLEKLFAKNAIAYVDFSLAERILGNIPGGGEEAAALICYLSLAVRSGYLCVNVEEQGIFPSIDHFFLEEKDSILISLEEKEVLYSLIQRGAEQIPEKICSDVANIDNHAPQTQICRSHSSFYFQRYWLSKRRIENCLKNISITAPVMSLDSSKVNAELSLLEHSHFLLPEQAAAILTASHSSLTIITGGPGTGKTFTAGQLIKLIYSALSEGQQKSYEIALAAPTGKAAANLQKSLSRAIGNTLLLKPIRAKTLHSLLEMRASDSERNPSLPPLSADLIVIDESSMIDTLLIVSLLEAVKPGGRIIFLGDKYQLSPVGIGNPFTDMVAYFSSLGKVVELHTCLRVELQSIVSFAKKINAGDADEVMSILKNSPIGVTHILPDNEPNKNTQELLIMHSLPFYKQAGKKIESPELLLNGFNQFRILSPKRKGLFGVEQINELFAHRLMKDVKEGEWFCSPIMIVQNDHHAQLFNGEVGVLIRRKLKKENAILQEGDYAIFADHEGVKKIPAILLPKYEYAYCLSVHKSQGSEFDRVLLLLPPGSELFGREMLYTAATRAKKQLEVWGGETTVRNTVDRKSR